MSGSVNKVILVGRLGGDPEVRYTAEGTAVANFSLATDESFTDRAGDRQRRTEWHRIVAWKRLAEVSGEFLSKGNRVYIEGSLRNRKWQNRDGNERTTVEVVATWIVMLGRKMENRARAALKPRERQLLDLTPRQQRLRPMTRHPSDWSNKPGATLLLIIQRGRSESAGPQQ